MNANSIILGKLEGAAPMSMVFVGAAGSGKICDYHVGKISSTKQAKPRLILEPGSQSPREFAPRGTIAPMGEYLTGLCRSAHQESAEELFIA